MIPGLSSLSESLQSLISRNFLISGFLPTVLFVLASFWPVSVVWPEYWASIAAQLDDLDTIGGLLSLRLLALIVAAYVVWSFRATFRELLEGRYLWPAARDRLTAFQAAYRRQLEERRQALRSDLFALRKVASMDVFEARNVDPGTDDAATVELGSKQWANTLYEALVGVRGKDGVKPAGGDDLGSLAARLTELKAKRARQERIDYRSLESCYDEIVGACTPDAYRKLSPAGDGNLAAAAAELPHLAQYALAKVESEYSRLSSRLSYRFPNDHLAIGPTALANMSEIQRSYAEVRYGISIDLIRPRLQKLIDEDASFSSLLESTQSHVDANVVMTVLAAVYGLVWFLPMAVLSATPASFIVLVGASALASTLFYALAVQAARRHGEVLRSAVDLFRFDLLELLHIGKPADSGEEVALWNRVMGHIALGSGDALEYEHGDALGDPAADAAVPLDDDGESRIESLLTDIGDRLREVFR